MKELYTQLGRELLKSCGLFALLFAVLWVVEKWEPDYSGKLLQWSNTAFLVGIPANIIGVAYVLTIRNPKNYTGFYAGIVMSILLAVQFYLQGNYDLMVLYLCVFIPFMIRSVMLWKRGQQDTQSAVQEPTPSFTDKRSALISLVVAVVLLVVDYWLQGVMQGNTLSDNIALKIASATTLSASVLANYWLMYQKNDAWIYWVVFSLAGMALFLMIGNMFSTALYIVFLYVNRNAQKVWLAATPDDQFGWAGTEEKIRNLREHGFLKLK